MENNENIPDERIEKLANNEDLNGLNELVQQLSPEEIQVHKMQLSEAYLCIFSVWHADWVLDKIETKNPEGFIAELLSMLDAAERIDPDNIRYAERAECHKRLAELPSETATKLAHLQQAIEIYETALEKPSFAQLHTALADTLLDKILLTEQFDNSAFEEALQQYRLAYAAYSEYVFSWFLQAGFRLLNFPFVGNREWHNRFLNELSEASVRFAQQDSFVYLVWSDELARILQYNRYHIPADYAERLQTQSIDLLAVIQSYETQNAEKLNRLGFAFERVAKQTTDVATKLLHYETALKHFTQGQSVNPAAWTFPVYATNVLMAMAKIYYSQQNQAKVNELFEMGKKMLAKNTHPNDFQLALYRGNFLIEYARLAHEFHAPEILQEAESVLLIAKEQGRQFYSQPYLSLAKVALNMGDKAKCLSILQECQTVFTTPYYKYDWKDVWEDEDFREIWREELLNNASAK